ncbi:hypothetical protein H7F10_04415 [Acidithiobacillus sp. HP-6]|uniref:hypothetical protein n=1 Tax=unclassified Acidithiobacillus TaxID=2614800 RepID=UPI00187B0EEC|nr:MULTISPECIES: hypothetical protein [unclassified Acidithiobacillus]MBE7562214.1 hypothetical protein [Acidithiobacillus sp. HP-6]MBE7568939.1 hypothetical protein [Acidithiobacillus sp. HP-2]
MQKWSVETIHHKIPEKAKTHHRYGWILLGLGGASLGLAMGLFWVLHTGILNWIMILIRNS